MPSSPLIVGMFFLAIFFLLVLWAAKGHRWLQKTEKLIGAFAFTRNRRLPARMRLVRWRFYRWLGQFGLMCALLIRRRKGVLLINLVLATIQWIARYGILPCILLAFSIQIEPWPLIATQGLLMTSSMFLVLPGGGGGVEIAMSFVLKHFVPLSSIGVIVLLWRLFTYHINLAAGGIVFFRLCQKSSTQEIGSPSSSEICRHQDAPNECQLVTK